MDKKKYIIKESELKEIIKEMILLEISNPNDFSHLYTSPQGKQAAENLKFGNLLNNLSHGIGGGIRGLIPDNWKERVENGDSGFARWLLGLLGPSSTGAVGPDIMPNITNSKALGGQGLGTGNNSDAHEVFNVEQACNWLRAHSYPYYIKGKCGSCAKYVRTALNTGGLSAPWGNWADEAKDYLNILPKNGWEMIQPSAVGQPGDIIVMGSFVTTDTKQPHRSGHIAMFCGDQWISDYKQRNAYGINGQVPPEAVRYFRYKNIAKS